jgi:hypothetical protein
VGGHGVQYYQPNANPYHGHHLNMKAKVAVREGVVLPTANQGRESARECSMHKPTTCDTDPEHKQATMRSCHPVTVHHVQGAIEIPLPRLSEYIYACDGAQTGSVVRLSLGAHRLPSFRLGVHGRL